MNIAYAFLTRIPNYTLINFAECIYDKHKIDIYIFIDDENFVIPSSKNINYVKINSNECRKNNMCCAQETVFANTQGTEKTMVHSWDKSLYYFTHVNTTYEFVWFIEDDVFIPSDDTILNIDIKYKEHDLLVANNNISKDFEVEKGIWHWKYAIQIFGFPSYCSMTCACRMSHNLLMKIKEFALQNGFIPFHEFSFNTIAMNSALSVQCPQELSTVKYDTRLTLEDIKNNKNNLFHPIKAYDQHEMIREFLRGI
ncbi:hypothetical protein [Flavobacterium sp.]|jgi:hypothetical protein|uniref:hypothetical protein n=1 Tax=Flavobacterium sp. TaxID=239 RepID=UPI0037C0A3F6